MAKDVDKKKFAAKWRERFEEISSGHGDKSPIAEACGVSLSSVSVWGQPIVKKRPDGEMKETTSLPDLMQCELAANTKNISPAWLAWGLGPKEKKAFEWGIKAAEVLAVVPDAQREKFMATAMTLSGLDFSVSPPADSRAQSASLPLSDSEVVEALAFVLRVQRKGFGEGGDFAICARLATLLAEESDARKLGPPADQSEKVKGSGGKDQSSAGVGPKPASRRKR